MFLTTGCCIKVLETLKHVTLLCLVSGLSFIYAWLSVTLHVSMCLPLVFRFPCPSHSYISLHSHMHLLAASCPGGTQPCCSMWAVLPIALWCLSLRMDLLGSSWIQLADPTRLLHHFLEWNVFGTGFFKFLTPSYSNSPPPTATHTHASTCSCFYRLACQENQAWEKHLLHMPGLVWGDSSVLASTSLLTKWDKYRTSPSYPAFNVFCSH